MMIKKSIKMMMRMMVIKRRMFVLVVFCVLLLVTSCAEKIEEIDAAQGAEKVITITEEKTDVAQVGEKAIADDASELLIPTFFHYQLQDVASEKLSAFRSTFIVVDIDEAELSREDIVKIEEQGNIVLSYLSIGEAEDYRTYWQEDWQVGKPVFVDAENLEWEGNYKVRYWESAWQEIILERVREIARTGYNGVYLDIIDAYEYYEEEDGVNSTQEMILFVEKIREEGKKIDPDFLVFAQNGVLLYEKFEYHTLIDGFGVEDTWYNDDVMQEKEHTEQVLTVLRKARADSKIVLAIDYATEQDLTCDFYGKCQQEGFVCAVGERDLKESAMRKCWERN